MWAEYDYRECQGIRSNMVQYTGDNLVLGIWHCSLDQDFWLLFKRVGDNWTKWDQTFYCREEALKVYHEMKAEYDFEFFLKNYVG